MPIKLTTEQFISKAQLIHGNRYDYSETVYINSQNKVKINCPEHGEYLQTPSEHLRGKACPLCTGNKATQAKAKSEFVSKAQEIHGYKYTYDLVNYVNAHTKVTIACPTHGIYEQIARNHLNGNGCPLCSGSKARQAKAASEFVSRSQEIHNNEYDYSLVNYVNSTTKVSIMCMSHGIFNMKPNSHLSGAGCPTCAKAEKGWTRTKFKQKCTKNNDSKGILYVLECFNNDERFIKIGITSNSIKRRYNSQTSMPYEYTILHEIVGSPEFIYDLETLLHKKSRNYKYTPSIPFGGHATECFEANPTYLDKLNIYLDFKRKGTS